jgi:hypothetical protein
MNKAYTIDYDNIGLMILSCIIAFFIPFELFLFSYAILGPLHYLTEIGWLHQRQYFAKGKYDFLLLVFFGLLLFAAQFGFAKNLAGSSNKLILLSFVTGCIIAFVKDYYLKIILVVVLLFSMFFVNSQNSYIYIFFGVFLPTLIHVFLFTALFMLFGALKSRSWPGILSVVVLFGCAAALFLINPSQTYEISDYVRESWFGFDKKGDAWGFVNLNIAVLDYFKVGSDLPAQEGLARIEQLVFHSKAGFLLTRFVAFAYTYHYLNWFSKTSVIKWHKVDKRYLYATVLLWFAAIGTYMYDYATGLKVLFLLSFMHVLLEFPLNFQSFVGIGKEARNMFAGKKTGATN